MALNFPAKVYQILENESCDIIRWHENGMAFRILDHGRFEREIIPKYFRRKIKMPYNYFKSNMLYLHTILDNQISSVQRQLNLYGFKCISRGEDKGAFFHPSFRRGDWETVRKITRYIPTRKVFSLDNQSSEKKTVEEDYVFHGGCYQSANALRTQTGEVSNVTNQSYYSPDGEPFVGFQHSVHVPQQYDGRNLAQPAISSSDQSGLTHTQQNPSALTSRLGYKFPSVAQLKSSVAASRLTSQLGSGDASSSANGGHHMREFIIYTSSGTVQIDPDFDLHDCLLNATVDYDIGRHSVNAPPPVAMPMHQHFRHPNPQHLHHSLVSAVVGGAVSVGGGDTCGGAGLRSRSNSMDDFAELCADLAE